MAGPGAASSVRGVGDTGEKTEEATPEKLRKAKEEGQVPKSQDFVAAMGVGAGFGALAASVAYIIGELKDFTARVLESGPSKPEMNTVFDVLSEAIPLILRVILPMAAIVFVIGIFSNVIQTGFFLAFKAITPKLDKINPANGLKNLFKVKKFVDLLKNVIKFTVTGWLAWDIMSDALSDMVLVVAQPIDNAIVFASWVLAEYLIKTVILFLVIGAIDLIWSRKVFAKEMMMSKYDIKQEYKQQEGDPQMKGERRRRAHEALFGGGAQNVKQADAVVVNPAHIAVAIKYDREKTQAPQVVAKGMRVHAERIKELAKEYGVPILRNVPLAQALYKLDVDEEIPEELYEAVAEVLAFVYKLKEQAEARQSAQRAERAQAYQAERAQVMARWAKNQPKLPEPPAPQPPDED